MVQNILLKIAVMNYVYIGISLSYHCKVLIKAWFIDISHTAIAEVAIIKCATNEVGKQFFKIFINMIQIKCGRNWNNNNNK